MPHITNLKLRRKIANRFLRFRERYKLTQTEFGKLIGIGKVEVIHIEKARRYPQYSTIDRFKELAERFQRGKQTQREKIRW